VKPSSGRYDWAALKVFCFIAAILFVPHVLCSIRMLSVSTACATRCLWCVVPFEHVQVVDRLTSVRRQCPPPPRPRFWATRSALNPSRPIFTRGEFCLVLLPSPSLNEDRSTLAGSFTVINQYLVEDLRKLGLWTPQMKNAIIGAGGSIQGISSIPADLKELYKTVWEIKVRRLRGLLLGLARAHHSTTTSH
jgi:hypothetical protein